MILHLLKRLFFILLGYALATVASAAVVTAAHQAHGALSGAFQSRLADMPGNFAVITMLIGIYAALPAALTVITGEIRPVRSRLYYMIAGCVIGTGLPIFVGIYWWYVPIGFLFGFVAGLIYWRVAGCSAGFGRSTT